jgi:hypothetical protein
VKSYNIKTPPKTAATPATTAFPVTLGIPPVLCDDVAAAEDEAAAAVVCEAPTLDPELACVFDTPVGS